MAEEEAPIPAPTMRTVGGYGPVEEVDDQIKELVDKVLVNLCI